jgi:hypothetical protein
MSCRLPVIAARRTGRRRFVAAGTGWLVPPDDEDALDTLPSVPALPVAGAGVTGAEPLPAAPKARLGSACMLVPTDSGRGVRGLGV